jgi:predicted AAA+ superfamily ATPase
MQTQSSGENLTFEKVWAMFQETDRKFKETDTQIEKTEKLLEKTIEQYNKNLGGLNRSMGELIETLIAARLWEKFSAYPYNLQRSYQRVNIYDDKNRTLTDIDILLADSKWVMAVEVKREVDKEDIEHHLRRMELIRNYPPAEVKGKELLGAIAGGVVPPDIRDQAYKAGFFVLELTGDSVALAPQPEGFTPKTW